MKTQITVRVKPDSLMSYTNLPIWFLTPKKRRGHFIIYVDGDYKAGKEPIRIWPKQKSYTIELEPGVHELYFFDSLKKSKGFMKKTVAFAAGATIGALAGGFSGALLGGSSASENLTGKKVIEDSYLCVELREGDDYRIEITPSRKGIKIKELN